MSEQRASKKQKELLQFVDGFIKGNGYGPSYREIMRSLGYKSVSTVAVHIDGLIAGGYLLKRDNSARSLEVVHDDTSAVQPAQSTYEIWLMNHITTRCDRYETSPEEVLLREIQTLLDSLKILGFTQAYTRMSERIASYQ